MTLAPPRSILRLLAAALLLLAGLMIIGTAFYRWVEGMSTVDALYMTVLTLSTVGFEEVKPLSPTGRIFTVGLIVAGVALALYTVAVGTELVLSGEWQRGIERRREHRMLANLSKHVIVCGYGRVGRHVVHQLDAEGVPSIVIDSDPTKVEHLHQAGHLVLQGNAADEEVLKAAGILRARALVVTVNSDAENVFIVLSARGLRADLEIISRANFEASESKLLRAGATRVLSPYQVTGRRMVSLIVRPEVADFLEEVAHVDGKELLLEQVTLAASSRLVGQTLAQARVAGNLNLTIVACRGAQEPARITPNGDTVLNAGMELLVLGTRPQVQEVLAMAKGQDKG